MVSDVINYDLLKTMDDIQNGVVDAPGFLKQPRTKTRDTIPDAIRKAEKCPAGAQ